MPQPNRPLLAITMGDPAGVGPEVVVGAWSNTRIHEVSRPIVLGHPEILRRAVRLLKRELQIVELDASMSLQQAVGNSEVLSCVRACDDDVLDIPVGKLSAQAG